MKKINEYYNKFKELWAVPRYRALIKLSLYGLMFLLLIIMANIQQESKNISNVEENPKTFAEIINSTNLEEMEILYTIKINEVEYKLEGKIQNNIILGYLENNGNINKIKFKDNIVYNIINETEIVNEDLNNLFIKEFLIPENIVKLVNNESAYIEKEDTQTINTYNITYNEINYEIKLVTDLEYLTTIIIKNENTEYNLKLIFDKKD